MATSKLNIFHTLARHDSDSEDEGNQRTQKTNANKNNDRARNDDKAKTGKGAAQSGTTAVKDSKEEHQRHKDARKDKHVTAEPHPLDRHSGTNTHAYGTKPKKGGAGKGNWGKTEQAGVEGEEERAGDSSPEVKAPVEEEKPTLTLQEYYELQKKSQDEPQINEAKAKITSEHLKKELGNSTLLKSKNQQEVDDRKVGRKRETVDVNHRAALNSEHAQLLGFRTGFVEKEYKKRDPEDAGQRRTGPRTGGRGDRAEEGKQEETAQTTEGTTATATTTQEGTATTQEGQTEGQTQEQTGERREQGQGERRGGNRGGNYRGGNRGGNRGEGGHRGEHRGEGGHRGEHREGGNRGGNRGGQQGNQKPVVTDESAFPKLG